MSGPEVLQSVQFVTAQGKRFAVIDGDDWDSLIEWLETLEDAQAVRTALATLKAADGDRTKAGWLKWDDVEDQHGAFVVHSLRGTDTHEDT